MIKRDIKTGRLCRVLELKGSVPTDFLYVVLGSETRPPNISRPGRYQTVTRYASELEYISEEELATLLATKEKKHGTGQA